MATTNIFEPLKRPFTRTRGYWDDVRTNPGTWYGLDLAKPTGNYVYSPLRLKILLTNYDRFSGYNILAQVRWSTGNLGNLYFWFAHLSKFNVKRGQSVTLKTIIARSGATGTVSGPHLHWSILVRNAWGRYIPVNPEDTKRFKLLRL